MEENTHEHIELRSEQTQEILEAVPNWTIRWGNTLVLIIISMLLWMSWFVKYPDIIISQAMITTRLSPQKLYAQTSGQMDTILVKDLQHIVANTPLAIIENTANYKDVYLLKSIIDTVKPNNKTFYFPIDELPVLFLGDIESDYAIFENNYLQYILNKQLRPFDSERTANNNIKAELHNRLRSLQSQKQLNQSELAFHKNDLDRHKTLFEKGIISEQTYEAKQLVYHQAQRSYANMDLSISQVKELISNAKKTAVRTSIHKTQENVKLLKTVVQSFNQLKRAIKDWEMRYVLTSKISGNVSFLNVWNQNQSVNQGDLVFTIIPENNNWFIAKLKTPAQNSGKIKEGQRVNIKLESYPETKYGSLRGKVKSISLTPNDKGLYLINATLPEKLITSYHKEISFKHEMLGSAEIITEDLRLIERFFYQLKNVLHK